MPYVVDTFSLLQHRLRNYDFVHLARSQAMRFVLPHAHRITSFPHVNHNGRPGPNSNPPGSRNHWLVILYADR